MTDPIQTVREALDSWETALNSVSGPAAPLNVCLDRIEAVVKAARDVDAGAWGYTVDEDSASPLVELHYRLAALDSGEEIAP